MRSHNLLKFPVKNHSISRKILSLNLKKFSAYNIKIQPNWQKFRYYEKVTIENVDKHSELVLIYSLNLLFLLVLGRRSFGFFWRFEDWTALHGHGRNGSLDNKIYLCLGENGPRDLCRPRALQALELGQKWLRVVFSQAQTNTLMFWRLMCQNIGLLIWQSVVNVDKIRSTVLFSQKKTNRTVVRLKSNFSIFCRYKSFYHSLARKLDDLRGVR